MPRKNKYATNKDLAKKVRKNLKIPETQARLIIDRYFNEIKQSILDGKHVNLSGFGAFDLKKWKTDEYYSINEGKKIKKELKTVAFKPSRNIKSNLD